MKFGCFELVVTVLVSMNSWKASAAPRNPNQTPELHPLIPGSFQRLPVDPRLTANHTIFKKLNDLFDHAHAPTLESVHGWYTGRCFYLDSPTRAVASLLAVESSADLQANGPAFASSDYRRVVPLVSREAGPDYFDQLTGAKEKNIGAALRRLSGLNAYPVRQNDMLVIEGMRTVDFESREYLLRSKKQFLFLRLTCNERSYCMNYLDETPTNRMLVYEGETPAMCYYFKRVKP